MDNLQKKIVEIVEIDELEEKIKELGGKYKQLERKIVAGENEICKIIKDAIGIIVEGESIVLDAFKEESLKKISEIIKDKKAYNKYEKELKVREENISIKKKEYILLYIENKKIDSNMVIDHYEYEAQAQNYSKPIVYIVYIKDGDKILQIDNAKSSRSMISGKKITIPQQDISTNIIIDLDKYELDKTYERIKTNKNEIRKDIIINII
jgi:hypothetical protein